MGQFHYYLPNVTIGGGVTLDLLQKKGLATVFDASGYVTREVDGGPDNKRGVVVSYAESTGYYPKKQEWQKIHGADAWVGYDKTNIPKASDLQRISWIDGYYTELGNGEKWIAPRARLADGLPNLPCSHDLVDGTWTRGNVVKKHQKLWSVAEKFWSTIEHAFDEQEGEESISLSFPEENDFAVIALSANYRIGRTEAAILQLLDDESVSGILNALVDWPSIVKKKLEEAEQENSSDNPGKQD
jgi:hypothetical protein